MARELKDKYTTAQLIDWFTNLDSISSYSKESLDLESTSSLAIWNIFRGSMVKEPWYHKVNLTNKEAVKYIWDNFWSFHV